MFGPVNNPLHPDGWIKTRCLEDDYDDTADFLLNLTNLMWGNVDEDQMSVVNVSDELNTSTASAESTSGDT